MRAGPWCRATGSVALLALLLGGCGVAGGKDAAYDGASTLAGLRVGAAHLPAASRGEPFGPVVLTAIGSDRPLTWRVWSGALPTGLVLDPDGRLRGTPTQRDVGRFSVHVTDGRLAGTASFAIGVDSLALYAHEGLVGTDAWTGRSVSLGTSGARGDVVIDVVANASGGTLSHVDPVAGTATWRPGTRAGHDVLRAVESSTGRRVELDFDVRPDPTAGHEPEFGASDVWYVNPNRKYGAHAYASDMQAMLADIGFRALDSYDMVGTPADRLAETWIRLEMLRQLNVYYLRQADGSAGAAGLPVSFPFHEPGPGYRKPETGGWVDGAPHTYSELSLIEGRASHIVGTAFVDDGANALHENNTTAGVAELGVFLNVVANYWHAVYTHYELREEPIHADDTAALHALLHDLPSPGGRYEMLREAGRDLGRVLATVVAHEIGHSLGLGHSGYRVPDNSIMSSSAVIGPWTDPAFLPEDVERMRGRLPGPGRLGASHLQATSVPGGGLRACRGTCNLRVVYPSWARRR